MQAGQRFYKNVTNVAVQSHQQFLSFFGLKYDKVGLYVHVDVAVVIVNVSMLPHYPDVVIS